jgi:hypothetical protein
MVDASTGGGGEEYMLVHVAEQTEHEQNQLVIDEEGNVTAAIGYAQTGSTPRNLGWYCLEAGHDDPDLIEIGRILRERSLGEAPSLSVPAPPGMRATSFTVRMRGGQVIHLCDADAELPAPLAELEARLRPLYGRVATQPCRVVSLGVTFSPTRVTIGETLRFEFAFEHQGRFPAKLRNPIGAGGSIHVNLWNTGKNEVGEEALEFAGRLDFEGREFLTAPRKALRGSDAILSLGVGETLSAWTEFRLGGIEPGDYTAEAVYYAEPMSADDFERHNDLVVGELHAPLVALSVLAP